ncbi:MAG: DUF3024 domain-containing protein [Rhodocyclaceae bacterium]|nr:DUF3024 domain-containing protein [Rhodocyclaceae bacterium]
MDEFIQRIRPPEDVREKLDFEYRLKGQSVEIYEVRPRWKRPAEKTELPVAKATYVRKEDSWKIYWHRADGKWHRYEPNAEAASLVAFLSVVERDEYGCFFG